MTNEKARDFFSSYYEGTLDPGLAQTLELKLDGDVRLKNEYRNFATTMDDLYVLRTEDIQAPANLSEKINARLDKEIWDKKQRQPVSFFGWLKGLAAVGVAGIAIAAAFISLSNRSGDVATSGVIAVSADKATFKTTKDGLVFSYQGSVPKMVVITGESGKEIDRKEVGTDASPKYSGLLQNTNDHAAAFIIEIHGVSTNMVVVPGKAASLKTTGAGSLQDYAKAFADFYRIPVVLQVSATDRSIVWKFQSPNIIESASNTLGSGYRATLLSDNILQIEEN